MVRDPVFIRSFCCTSPPLSYYAPAVAVFTVADRDRPASATSLPPRYQYHAAHRRRADDALETYRNNSPDMLDAMLTPIPSHIRYSPLTHHSVLRFVRWRLMTECFRRYTLLLSCRNHLIGSQVQRWTHHGYPRLDVRATPQMRQGPLPQDQPLRRGPPTSGRRLRNLAAPSCLILAGRFCSVKPSDLEQAPALRCVQAARQPCASESQGRVAHLS